MISPEVRNWQTFLELFLTLPIADAAKEFLREHYRRNDSYLAVEMLMDFPILSELSDVQKSGGGGKVEGVLRLPKLAEVELLAGQLESKGVIADAYYYYKLIAELYGEEGKKIAAGAFEREAFKNHIRKNINQDEWNKGKVDVQIDSDNYALQRRRGQAETGRNIPAYSILQIARGNRSSGVHQSIPVNFLSTEEPFLSPNLYFIESRNNEGVLAAYDNAGNELWQFNLTDHFDTARYSAAFYNRIVTGQLNFAYVTVLMRLVRGCDHLVVVAIGNKLIAIDTFGCGNGSDISPRFLWSRQLSTGNNFTEKWIMNIPTFRAVQTVNSSVRDQSKLLRHEVLFCVSKNVICYRDGNKIYGVNPLTGDAIWTRNAQGMTWSIYGDRDSLFLFDLDTRQVIAIEPLSGIELKRGVLAGDVLTSYGTSVLLMRLNQKQQLSEIFVTDLCDIFRDDVDIKLCESGNFVQNELCRIAAETLPVRMISPTGTDNMIRMVKPLDDLRYISFWVTSPSNGVVNLGGLKNLLIYDLQNKSYEVGKVEDGICGGIDLSMAFNDVDIANIQVFRCADKFLVQVSSNSTMHRQFKVITDKDGIKYNSHILPLLTNTHGGNAQRNTVMDFFMLFDKNGERCWRERVSGNEWYLVTESMAAEVPVLIFSAIVRENEVNGARNKSYLGITVIDKMTGRKRCKKLIQDARIGNGNTQLIKFTTDKDENEIKLQCNDRIITIKFEQE
jgi:hypothetical protein